MTGPSRVILVALSMLAGCTEGGDRAAAVAIEVSVRDDDGALLPGAAILVDGADAGETTGDRVLVTRTREAPGTPVSVSVRCPAGYVAAGAESLQLMVRHLRPMGGSAASLSPLGARFSCTPLLKEHVLVVRTGGRAALPIRVTGVEVGRTDEVGVSHHLVKGRPGEEVQVVIDTAAEPRLRPASPQRRLKLPAKESFLVFDQAFDERREPARKARRNRNAGPRRL
jgi:hypothetical protein